MVTGASGGIGAALVRRLHREAVRLVVTGRRREQLEELAAETGAEVVVCDLTDRSQVEELAERLVEVDLLVHNAGLPASGDVRDFTPEEIDRALDVNLRAPMIISRLVVPHMVQRGRGHVVFISSLAGKVAQAGSAVYSATKFGMRGFAHGLRGDLDGTGVGVTVVCPGFIRDAGMFAETGVQLPPWIGTSSPEDVADAVVCAVRANKAEVDVAPLQMKLGARLGNLAPEMARQIGKRFGAGFSEELVTRQKAKR